MTPEAKNSIRKVFDEAEEYDRGVGLFGVFFSGDAPAMLAGVHRVLRADDSHDSEGSSPRLIAPSFVAGRRLPGSRNQ